MQKIIVKYWIIIFFVSVFLSQLLLYIPLRKNFVEFRNMKMCENTQYVYKEAFKRNSSSNTKLLLLYSRSTKNTKSLFHVKFQNISSFTVLTAIH